MHNEVVIKKSIRGMIKIILLIVVFFAGSIWIIADDGSTATRSAWIWESWVGTAIGIFGAFLFGVGGIVYVVQTLRKSVVAVISSRGITFGDEDYTLSWSNIDKFELIMDDDEEEPEVKYIGIFAVDLSAFEFSADDYDANDEDQGGDDADDENLDEDDGNDDTDDGDEADFTICLDYTSFNYKEVMDILQKFHSKYKGWK